MNRLTLTVLTAAALAAALAGPARAVGFTGPTAPGSFTVANVGTLSGGAPMSGTATFSATQLLLAGSDTTSPVPASFAPGCTGGIYSTLSSPCQLQVTINLPGTYTFNWSYFSSDDTGPGGDIFGVLVNGNRIALSDLGGAVSQLGSASFVATTSFGWFINCTDCIAGAATATVSSLVMTPVPEPASAALLLAGAAVLCIARRHGGAAGAGRRCAAA